MAAKHQLVTVTSEAELEASINGYIASGFVIQNRTADSVVLFKKKEFNILWAVIGFLLCLLPLLIYLIVYAIESDQLVEIRIHAASSDPQWSDDGKYWWDGSQWIPRAEIEGTSSGADDQELVDDGDGSDVPELEEATTPEPEAHEDQPHGESGNQK